MSILTRPRPPRVDEPADAEALEALIEEARQRARRRRRWYGACTLVASAAGLLGFYGFNHGGGATRPQGRAESPLGGAPAAAQGNAANWRLAPGLPGGDINELVVDPQHARVMFATTGAGVFKSANGGRTWRFLSIAPNPGRIDALTMAPGDPKTLYVGTGRGVFKTTDGGASWQAANSGLFGKPSAEERQHRLDEGYVYALVVDPRDPDTVYAGTWEEGLFKSTNGGTSWQRLGLGFVNTVVLDPTDPGTIYAGAVGADARGAWTGVFRSTDSGSSWRPVGLQGNRAVARQGTNVSSLVLDPEDTKVVYAVTDDGVFKSSDGGASWHAAGLAGKNLGRLLLDPQHPETLYAQAGARIFRSTDGTRTWRALTVGRTAELLALHPGNPAKLYAGSLGRLLTSPDAGRSWRATGRGPTTASVSALAVTAWTAYAGIEGGGVAKKAGGRWQIVSTYQSVTALAVDPQDRDVLYAGADDPARLLKSTDGGRSWRRLRVPWKPWISDPNLALVSALAVDPQNPKAVYAHMDNFADNGSPLWFKSTDGGATWEAAEAAAFFSYANGADSYPSALVFDPLDPHTLYAYGDGAPLFKSTNGGASWQRVGYPLIPASVSVQNLAIDPREPATLYAWGDEGVFKSADAGSTWRAVNAGLKDRNIWALAIDPRHRQTVYAGTDSGVFRSTEGGRSWSRFSRSRPPDGIETFAVDPARGILYAVGTDGGVYELRLPR